MNTMTIPFNTTAQLKSLGIEGVNLEALEVLITTKEEWDYFFNKFYTGEVHKLPVEIYSYRVERIDQSQMTYNDFCPLFQKNQKEACEELFMFPVDELVLSELEFRMKENQLTLRDFYDGHMEEPYDNPMLVLRDLCRF